jgi:hypothetical protein
MVRSVSFSIPREQALLFGRARLRITWDGRTMTLPFAGHPVGARNAKVAKNEEDKIESAYRFLLADLMPFGKTR